MDTHEAIAICHIGTEKKRSYKWLLALIMVAVIALGWKFPVLGFVVPVAMGGGIIGAFFRGRWVCGNACPRGSFLDTWFKPLAANRRLPRWLKSSVSRWSVLVVLMGFMGYRLSLQPTDPLHWGRVFWQMCLVTTLVALGLGLAYSTRAWCAICPVGTMAAAIDRGQYQLQIDPSCRGCELCANSCPMQLPIASYRTKGVVAAADCIKCSTCLSACPRPGVLTWPQRPAA